MRNAADAGPTEPARDGPDGYLARLERLAPSHRARDRAHVRRLARLRPPTEQTAESRVERGRALRRVLPRSELARLPGALAAVDAADPGSLTRRLAAVPHSGLIVQLCGNAGVDAFVCVRSSRRAVVVTFDELDDTLPGPFEWDVKRLCASVAVVACSCGLAAESRALLVTAAARSYRTTVRRAVRRPAVDLWSAAARPSRGDPASGWSGLRSVPLPLTLVDDSETRFEVEDALRAYRLSLDRPARHLLDRYRLVAAGDAGDQTRGGCPTTVAILTGHRPTDRLVLSLREVSRSALEEHLGASPFASHARRIVEGRRLLEQSGEPLLGWTSLSTPRERDLVVRPLVDRWRPRLERLEETDLRRWATACAETLARGHARSGDPVILGAYLGRSDAFERAMVSFARCFEAEATAGGEDRAGWLAVTGP